MRALLAGTFDPPTYGHLNLIERASLLSEKLFVVVAQNIHKSPLLPLQERVVLLQELLSAFPHIEVVAWEGLLVDFAQRYNIRIFFRGIRPLSDFEQEFEMAALNKALKGDIETLFLPADPAFYVFRSSVFKSLLTLGKTVLQKEFAQFIPPNVQRVLLKRIKKVDKEPPFKRI